MKQKVNVATLKPNETNPRYIKDSKFKKLVKSIKEFPEMMEKRPIVVDENMVVLGGNMRLEASKAAGLFEVWIDVAEGWTEEQKKEFIIKDNVGFGEWDWDILANDWSEQQLESWGLDGFPFEEEEQEKELLDNNIYTTKIETPIYNPSNKKPSLNECINLDKYNNLLESINLSNLNEENKKFLKICAYRHIEYNYEKIADLYAHSNKNLKELIEESALVIIDYNKAIELGYVQLAEEISTYYLNDYGDE